MNIIPLSWRNPTGRKMQLDSAALSSVKYNPRLRELEVEFTSGASYQYGCVEPHTYRELISAPSAGKYFVAKVRNDHPVRKVAV
jgi:hypothetical protein